jgi:hypothetical protein
VAGFNQFFDEVNGTRAWQYSVGIDYNPISFLFMGGELSWRKAEQFGKTPHRNGSHHLAYLYWLPTEWLSFRAEYQYDMTDRDFIANRQDVTFPSKLISNQVPLSINFFHPKGFFSKITGTYVNQHADFVSEVGIDKHRTEFWTVDTSFGFRFPKKMGLISLEIRNLLNNHFSYQSTSDPSGPQLSSFVPERQFFAKLSLYY